MIEDSHDQEVHNPHFVVEQKELILAVRLFCVEMYTCIYKVSLLEVIIFARATHTGPIVYGYLVKKACDIGDLSDMLSHRRAAAPVLPSLAD